MTDFNLEQCKNLAKWGMPQELEYGDWCWVPVTDGQLVIAGHPGANYVRVIKFHSESPPPKYFKIPSLDELMEFAKTLCDPALYWDGDQWVAQVWGRGDMYHNDKRIFAVYALIEKLKMR